MLVAEGLLVHSLLFSKSEIFQLGVTSSCGTTAPQFFGQFSGFLLQSSS